MIQIIKIEKKKISGSIELPFSKSILNRWLIIHALADAKLPEIGNMQSHDVLLLAKAINQSSGTINFEDAGTPARLFLAYAAVKCQNITISSNIQLKRRPFAHLVEALSALGAEIIYLEKEGYLPVQILKTVNLNLENVSINGSLSSQFISGLLLISPYFSNGLNIQVTGAQQSEKYIDTTISVMQQYGAVIKKNETGFYISPKKYQIAATPAIEADWSAATFIYSLAAIAPFAQIFIPDLKLNSIQGDSFTASLYKQLGVQSIQKLDGVQLIKTGKQVTEIEIDFTNIPDMFPAVVAGCAALKIKGKFTGIKNLTLKESNRIIAMKENLWQTGALLELITENEAVLSYFENEAEIYTFKSYNDHRIVMACSIFAFYKTITIDDETVVAKSFPNYWDFFRDLTSI